MPEKFQIPGSFLPGHSKNTRIDYFLSPAPHAEPQAAGASAGLSDAPQAAGLSDEPQADPPVEAAAC